MALDQDSDRSARILLFASLEPGGLRLLAFWGETRIVLADTALVPRGPHRRSAVVQEISPLFLLPCKAVLRLLEEDPDSARQLLAFLTRRLDAALPTGDRSGL